MSKPTQAEDEDRQTTAQKLSLILEDLMQRCNGGDYSGKSHDRAFSEIMRLKSTWQTEIAKAYGGCENCYGKGYATTVEYASGYGTDGDIGGYEGPIKIKQNPMRYCVCERGKQLKQLVDEQQAGVRREMLEKLPKKQDPTAGMFKYNGEPLSPVETYNHAIDLMRERLER